MTTARFSSWTLCWLLTVLALEGPSLEAGTGPARGRETSGISLFSRDNLQAWCIVPFDSRKRGPAERVEMLERLGFRHYAYDWRSEHVPTFEREVDELQKRGISLDAVWFPASLDDDARKILAVIEKLEMRTQLWVTMGDPAPETNQQAAKLDAAVRTITPLVDEAARLGCRVELYNHGGWFGEPENQLAIIGALNRPNVGIVYNLHHGHEHLERLPALLEKMLPHLDALNLNGMDPGGDKVGRKILPLGQGEKDLEVLRVVLASGYEKHIGILGHTEDDAEQRLADNLDGLKWLIAQLDGKNPGPRPSPRTPVPPRGDPVVTESRGWLIKGRPEYREPPLTVDCMVRVDQKSNFNILVASDTKASASHWELFTWPETGALTAYLPGKSPDHVRSTFGLADGRWHGVTMHYEPARVRLFVDGQEVANQVIAARAGTDIPGPLALGRLVEGGLELAGSLRWVSLRAGLRAPFRTSGEKPIIDEHTIGLWEFPETGGARVEDASPARNPALRPPDFRPDAIGSATTDRSIPTEPDSRLVAALLEEARARGDARSGAEAFVSPTVACVSCHKVGERGGDVGPPLTTVARELAPDKLVESIFWPRREIKEGYKATVLALATGEILQGYVRGETEADITLFDPTTGKEHRLAKGDIEDRKETGSLMPDGLLAALGEDQRRDLLRFLLDLESTETIPELPNTTPHSHGPASFTFARDPLDPSAWPAWREPVNRDRIYDFYAKEADAFRGMVPMPRLLPEYPGLDGGKFGHWGNQNEEVWADGRWNETDLGNLLSGVFRVGDLTVPKGVCVRLGERGELAACFNPETLCYEAVWAGGFVQFSSVRHGFMDGLRPVGEPRDRPEGQPPALPFQYHGYYRNGTRVLFAYRIGDVEYLDSPWVKADGSFERVVAPASEHPLATLTQGGPPQWPQRLQSRVRQGSGPGPYVVDTFEIPFQNPWKALFFLGDHDFLPDGSAVLCTMQGDVWRVELGDRPSELATWRRIASGLHQPLGLVVAEGSIHVLGRDQITRLDDLNGDGEIDHYKCVSNAYMTSPAGHDFICGLQRDSSGAFYTASGNQGLIRISPDGRTVDVIATGFRNPDGLGLGSDGTMTVPASEGEWTPASMVCEVREGGHYGYKGPRDGRPPDLPLVYLPRGLDNSSGGQCFAPADRRWGPMAGQLVHLSFGAGTWFIVLRDRVGDWSQGAVLPLGGEFRSGAHRGRFNPKDGQLYVSGMAGWGSYTPDDGSFQRVRYVGGGGPLPIGWKAHENGVIIHFDRPIDSAIASDPSSHFAQSWNYHYGPGYGSAEYSPSHPGTIGHDPWPITRAHVLEDGRSLFLEIEDLQPVNQLHLRLRTNTGPPTDLYATIHGMAGPFTHLPGYQPKTKLVAAHPILRDLATAAVKKLNPWRRSNPEAREITLEAGKNLTFATRLLRVEAGDPLRLTFVNPDVVPHNWVLARPGSLATVGTLANKLVADPEAVARHYVPESPDVLVYTDLVEPGGRFTISFQAPEEPGRYPFLCTFPGHWMVMNGVMLVEKPEAK